MAGTKEGATKLRQTMIEKYGSEEAWKAHMKSIGSKGGENGSYANNPDYKGGFAHPTANPALAGAKGGRISRRKRNDS